MDGSKNATAKLDSATNELIKGASTGLKKSEQKIKLPASYKDGSSLPKAFLLPKNSKDGYNCTSAKAGVMGVSEDAGTTSDVRPRSGGRPLEIRFTDVESCGGQIHTGKPSSTAPSNNQQDALESTASTSLSRTNESSSSNQQFLVDENSSFGSSGIYESRPATGENICRICHEGDQVELLISPCMCRGTLSLVHRTCLQHWLAESDSSNCELCRFRYMTKRVPKYSLFGSFIAWLKLNGRQRKALVMDSISIIAFIPFATLITYVAADLADAIEYQDSPTFFDVTIRFGIVSLISMMTTIDVAFATWGILRAQHHFATWYSWYRRNSDVTLIPHLNNPTG